jgi:hypothetical protein
MVDTGARGVHDSHRFTSSCRPSGLLLLGRKELEMSTLKAMDTCTRVSEECRTVTVFKNVNILVSADPSRYHHPTQYIFIDVTPPADRRGSCVSFPGGM